MADLDRAAAELREMDDLAAMKSPVHALHPLAKLAVTVAYIFLTVSFDKYDLSGLAVMVLYPVLLFQFSDIPVRTCFYKLRIVLIPVCAVGLFNPFLDRGILLTVGGIAVSGGVISMITLLMKGTFALMASFLLAATTPIEAICLALRSVHVPEMIVTLLLLTYRYIAVLMEEAVVMMTAYRLRAPGQKGVRFRAWGSFLGQLLLRSMDRAEELYSSMLLRGFHGEFPHADVRRIHAADVVFAAAVTGILVFLRMVDAAALLGGLVI